MKLDTLLLFGGIGLLAYVVLGRPGAEPAQPEPAPVKPKPQDLSVNLPVRPGPTSPPVRPSPPAPVPPDRVPTGPSQPSWNEQAERPQAPTWAGTGVQAQSFVRPQAQSSRWNRVSGCASCGSVSHFDELL